MNFHRAFYYPLLAYFIAGAIVANLLALALAALRRPTPEREARCRRMVSAMTAHFIRVCPLAGFTISNESGEALKNLRGAVVASNHLSLIDAPALFSADAEMVCFYKAGLRRTMLGLPCARHAGFIANDAGIAGIVDAVAKIRAGRNVLVFPESTRTSAGRTLDPFKRSAALLAVRAHAPVVCLAMRYDSPFLGKSSRMFVAPNLPLRLRITHAATLRPEDFPDAAALNEAMRDAIEKALLA